MRKIFPYIAFTFLLYAAWQYVGQPESNFTGISEAQAVPASVKPIKLAEIKQFLDSKETRVLFLYASWCPYCKKQIDGFTLLKDEFPTDHIIAVSTDKRPNQLAAYLNQKTDMPFTPYIYQGGSELKDFIKQNGGSFTGGIPYFAVFKDGNYVRESLGLTHPEKLQ